MCLCMSPITKVSSQLYAKCGKMDSLCDDAHIYRQCLLGMDTLTAKSLNYFWKNSASSKVV